MDSRTRNSKRKALASSRTDLPNKQRRSIRPTNGYDYAQNLGSTEPAQYRMKNGPDSPVRPMDQTLSTTASKAENISQRTVVDLTAESSDSGEDEVQLVASCIGAGFDDRKDCLICFEDEAMASDKVACPWCAKVYHCKCVGESNAYRVTQLASSGAVQEGMTTENAKRSGPCPHCGEPMLYKT